MKYLYLVIAVSLVMLLSATYNATAQSRDSISTISLNPVVVTGTGTYHKAENSPVAVKVISKKELEDSQATSLQEALTKLTTNITTHTNGMGTFVNFNGVSDDYLLILENGKRVSGDDRWDRISISNIKRIEILPGAAGALYGSDAIAGVINIITNDEKSGINVTNNTRITSKNRLDEDINVDINAGKFSSFLSYKYKQADNWQVNPYQEFNEGDSSVFKLTGRPMSTGFHSNDLNGRFEWRFNDRISIYVRGDYYDYKTDRPQSASYFTQSKDKSTGAYSYKQKTAYTYDLHHKSYLYGAGARWTPTNRVHLYVDMYSDNFTSKYNYWQTAEKEGYSVTRKRTHYYNENVRGIFRLADWNKLYGGVEFIQDYLTSESDNINSETSNTYNFFVQDEINIFTSLEGVIGLRYTYNDNFDSNFTPNVGLFYHIGGFRFRASYAGGYKTPTLSQLYATDQAKTASRYTLNNESLKAEKNDFWNGNAEYSNNWFSLSVSGFVNKIRDMINYRTMTQDEIDTDEHLTELYDEGWTTIRQRDNIDKATIKGINANLKFILPYGFTISGGYTYTDAKAKTKSLDKNAQAYVTTETPVDKSVRNVANIVATWDHSWGNYHLNININGHIQSKRYSSTYGYAPHYQQWDLNTRHSIALRQVTLEPGIGVENLFNQRDTSPWNSNFSTINPGRSLYVSFAVKFTD